MGAAGEVCDRGPNPVSGPGAYKGKQSWTLVKGRKGRFYSLV